jgi:hypothetical protein
VNRCTQVLHRNAWTPLHNRGKIVDMIAPVGVLIAAAALAAPAAPRLDPQHLPALPTRGFTLQLRTGVRLETMQGRPVGVLEGLFAAPDKATGSGLIMRDGRGRLFVLDLHRRRVRPVREQLSPVRGCRVTDGRVRLLLLVCGHTVKTARFRLGEARSRLFGSSRAHLDRSGTWSGPSFRHGATPFWVSGPQNARSRWRSSWPAG